MLGNFCFESMLERAGKNHSATVVDKCVTGTEKEVSFYELIENAQTIATSLKNAGIKPREIIGLKSGNRLEWIVWDLASIICDVVLQVFPEDISESDEKLREKFGLRLFISDTISFKKETSGIIDITSTIELSNITPVVSKAALTSVSDLHSKTFSSGTDGLLKGLLISRKGTELLVSHFIKAYSIDDNDSTIIFLPFSHFPQRLMLYACLWSGSSLCLTNVEEAIDCAGLFQPTFLSSQASFFNEAIHKYKNSPIENEYCVLGGKLRFIITAMASYEIIEKYLEIGIPVYEGYGITELGMVAWNYPNNNKYGTVGKPLNSEELMLAIDCEILIKRSSPLCIGYYDSKTNEKLIFDTNTYIHTGDLGEIDDTGYLLLKGRKKNTVTTKSGENYQLEAIELGIQNISGVGFTAVLYDEAQDTIVFYVIPDKNCNTLTDISFQKSLIKVINKYVSNTCLKRLVLGWEKPSMKNGAMTRSMKLDRAGMLRLIDNKSEKNGVSFSTHSSIFVSKEIIVETFLPRFIVDSNMVKEMKGYSFIVLRPHGEILERFVDISQMLKNNQVKGKYVNAPHITLLEVPPEHNKNHLRKAIARWASLTSPFEIIAEDVSATMFGLPLATIGVSSTEKLTIALANLRNAADSASLPFVCNIDVKDWIFHITLLDYREVTSDESNIVSKFVDEYEGLTSSTCLITQVELVSYEDGLMETSEIFLLG